MSSPPPTGAGLLRLVGHYSLGGEEQAGDGGRVLQGRAGHLDGVVDAGSQQVDVLAGSCVQAVACGQAADLVHNNAGLEAGVEGDLLQRGVDGAADDVRAGCRRLSAAGWRMPWRRPGSGQRHHRHDAFFNSSLRVADSVLNAVLRSLSSTSVAAPALMTATPPASWPGVPALLAVVVRIRVLDLGADLGNAASDLVGVACTFDDGGLVLGDNNLAGLAQDAAGGLELEAHFLGDDLAAGEDGDVGQLCLRRSPKPRP